MGLVAAAGATNEKEVAEMFANMSAEERNRILALVSTINGSTTPAGGGSRLGRPPLAAGKFLRVVTVNDVYKLDNYPRVAGAIKEFKAAAEQEDCVCVSTLPGDFLSPCTLTNLDGGVAMLRALNEVGIDYVMFGNHEFDLKTPVLQKRIKEYNGTWINSNVTFPELVDRNGKVLPEWEIIRVGDRKVALTAFLLDDMAQFAPIEPMPKIGKPTESLLKTFEKIKAAEGVPDAFLPMLHVNIKEDRAVCEFIGKQKEIFPITPVVLSSHDHEVYIEEAGKSLLVKVGMDAENIGIIDLYWDKNGKLCRNVHMIAAGDFPIDQKVLDFANHELDALAKLMDVAITEIPDLGKHLSTARVRFEMEPMVSFLLSEVKESMPEVEWVVLQGGNVRGGTPEYKPGPFTYGDIMKEFAFDTQMAIVSLPGKIVAETIKNTRTPEGTKPFFLHCDMDCEFAEDNVTVTVVNGAPFDPEKIYKISTYQFLLAGMGNLEPLGSYCKANEDKGCIPALECCLGIKNYFIETCMRQAWLQILGYKNIHEIVSAEDFEATLLQVFNVIDTDNNGVLSAREVHAFLEKSGVVSSRLVKFLISSFDLEEKGHIEMKDLLAIAH